MDPHEKPDKPETSIESAPLAIPDFEIDALARCLLPKIQVYFSSPEGQATFDSWKKQHLSNLKTKEKVK